VNFNNKLSKEEQLRLADLKRLQEEVSNSLVTQKLLLGSPLITCQGYLGSIGATPYSKYFEIPLTEDEETVLLDITKRQEYKKRIE